MWTNPKEAPTIEKHPCLIALAEKPGAPVTYKELTVVGDTQPRPRWFLVGRPVSDAGKISVKNADFIPFTFCPICGAFLLAEYAVPFEVPKDLYPASEDVTGPAIATSAVIEDDPEAE
jgi:hypothetical protein